MNSDKSPAALSPRNIMEMASAFQRSRVLLTAYELDIFSALGENRKSAADVAGRIDTDERATDRLMNALCAIGLLEKQDGKFSNTPLSSRFLVPDSPEYLSGLMHTAHLWPTWSTLTQAVRQGRSVDTQQINERGDAWLEAFIAAMHARAQAHAPAIADMLDLSGVSRVLDVGGGSGVYAMAFVRAGTGATATVFDLPNVIPLTARYIAEAGLSDRMDTVTGDYTADDLGTGFDLVFLSAIVHINSYDQNQALIRKCANALNPRGQVVVQDFIMDDGRTSPAFGAFFALNMLTGTDAGDTYTESEVRAWMETAGLSDVARKPTGFGADLVIGKKPQ